MALDGALTVNHFVSGCIEPEVLCRLLFCGQCARVIAPHPDEVQDDTTPGWCPRTLELVDQLDVVEAGGRSKTSFYCPDCETQLVAGPSSDGGACLRCPHCSWDSEYAAGLSARDKFALIGAAMRASKQLGDTSYTRRLPSLDASSAQILRGRQSSGGEIGGHAAAQRHLLAVATLASSDPTVGGAMPRVGAAGRPLSEARADFGVSGKSGRRKPAVGRRSKAKLRDPAQVNAGSGASSESKDSSSPKTELPAGIARLERMLEERAREVARQGRGQSALGDQGLAPEESAFDPLLGSGSLAGRRASRRAEHLLAAKESLARPRPVHSGEEEDSTRDIRASGPADPSSAASGAGSGDSEGGGSLSTGALKSLLEWAQPSAAGSRQSGGAWAVLDDDSSQSPRPDESLLDSFPWLQRCPRPLPLFQFRQLRCRRCLEQRRPGLLLTPHKKPADCIAPRAGARKGASGAPAQGTEAHYLAWASKSEFAARYLPSIAVTGFVPALPLKATAASGTTAAERAAAPSSRQDVRDQARGSDWHAGLSGTARSRARRMLHAVHPAAGQGARAALRAVLSSAAVLAAGEQFKETCQRELARDPAWEPVVPPALCKEVEADCLLGWVVLRAVNPVPAEVVLRLGNNGSLVATGEDPLGALPGGGKGAKPLPAAQADEAGSDHESSQPAWWPNPPQERAPLSTACAEEVAEEAAFAGARVGEAAARGGMGPTEKCAVVLEPIGLGDRCYRAGMHMPDLTVLEEEEDENEEEPEELDELENRAEAGEGAGSSAEAKAGAGPNDWGARPWMLRRVLHQTYIAVPVSVPPAVAIGLAAVSCSAQGAGAGGADREGGGEGDGHGEGSGPSSSPAPSDAAGAEEDQHHGDAAGQCMHGRPVVLALDVAVELPSVSAAAAEAWRARTDMDASLRAEEPPATTCVDMGQAIVGFGAE